MHFTQFMDRTNLPGGLRVDKFFSLIAVVLTISCQHSNNDLLNHLTQVRIINPMIPKDGWEIQNHEYWSSTIDYSLVRKNSDTIYYLRFKKILHDSIFNKGDDLYSILYYRKEFKDSKFEFVLDLGLNSDTNYFFKRSFTNPDSLIFIRGKYCYLFKNGYLNNDQSGFYFKNKDSLKRVKGDNLPKLPEILD